MPMPSYLEPKPGNPREGEVAQPAHEERTKLEPHLMPPESEQHPNFCPRCGNWHGGKCCD